LDPTPGPAQMKAVERRYRDVGLRADAACRVVTVNRGGPMRCTFTRQRIPPISTASDPHTHVADTSKCGWKEGINYFGPGSGSHHSAVMDGDGPWSRERLFGRAGRCE
jgi:hypothetical protein